MCTPEIINFNSWYATLGFNNISDPMAYSISKMFEYLDITCNKLSFYLLSFSFSLRLFFIFARIGQFIKNYLLALELDYTKSSSSACRLLASIVCSSGFSYFP